MQMNTEYKKRDFLFWKLNTSLKKTLKFTNNILCVGNHAEYWKYDFKGKQSVETKV